MPIQLYNTLTRKLEPFGTLQVRDRLKALGVTMEDSQEGSSWRY